jgi:hypothetical protein
MSYSREFWNEYHKGDHSSGNRNRWLAGGIGALSILILSINGCGSDKSPEPSTTTTTTTTTPETTTTTTTSALETTTTTTTAPKELFKFSIGNTLYNCVVIEPPHTVAPGEHIWKIVDEQNVPEDMPQRWIGTIELNQQKGTVGSNPNLIHPGDHIYELVDCTKTPGIPATE